MTWGASVAFGRRLRPTTACLALGMSTAAWAGPIAGIRDLPQDETWADHAKVALLARWDANHSGSIDLAGEVEAVPCGVWRALDRSYRRTFPGGFGLRVAYGFVSRPDAPYRYVGNTTLGIAFHAQIGADEAMAACGVAR